MKDERVTGTCNDCGKETSPVLRATVDDGGMNRDPGEFVCRGCNASRTRMTRRLEELPDTLHEIQSMRMAR